MFDLFFSEYLENASLECPFEILPFIYIVWYFFLSLFYVITVSFVGLVLIYHVLYQIGYHRGLVHFCALCAGVVNFRKSQPSQHFVNPYFWATLCNPHTDAVLRIRALLDTSSASSFISESVAKRLQLVQSRVAHESQFEWSVFVGLQPVEKYAANHANVRLYVKSGTSQLLNWQAPKCHFEEDASQEVVKDARIVAPVNMIIGQDLYSTIFASRPNGGNVKETLPVIITKDTEHIAKIPSIFGLVTLGCVNNEETFSSIFENFFFNRIVQFFSVVSAFTFRFETSRESQQNSINTLGAIFILCGYFETIVKNIIIGEVFVIAFKCIWNCLFLTLPRILKMFCTKSNLTVLRKYQVVPQPQPTDHDPDARVDGPIEPYQSRTIFAPILPVNVLRGEKVYPRPLNVLLDTSSQYSYIDHEMAQRLQLDTTVSLPHVISKQNRSFGFVCETVSVRISNCRCSHIKDTIQLYVDYKFNAVSDEQSLRKMKQYITKGKLVTSEHFDPARNVDIVIGLDLLPLFMQINPSSPDDHKLYQKELGDKNALFVNSRYGWTLIGADDGWFDLFIERQPTAVQNEAQGPTRNRRSRRSR